MADRPNTHMLREWSDTAMGRALRQELEPDAYSTIHAIDALRLALLAAGQDLVEALDERAALATGTRVTVLDDEDDEPFEEGHCGGYFCEVHNLHISCSHPDYDLLVDEHEALHAAEFEQAIEAADEQDATAADQVMAATELRQYLDTVEMTAQADANFAAREAARLVRIVRAGIAAGAAPAMRDAMAGIDQ